MTQLIPSLRLLRFSEQNIDHKTQETKRKEERKKERGQKRGGEMGRGREQREREKEVRNWRFICSSEFWLSNTMKVTAKLMRLVGLETLGLSSIILKRFGYFKFCAQTRAINVRSGRKLDARVILENWVCNWMKDKRTKLFFVPMLPIPFSGNIQKTRLQKR